LTQIDDTLCPQLSFASFLAGSMSKTQIQEFDEEVEAPSGHGQHRRHRPRGPPTTEHDPYENFLYVFQRCEHLLILTSH
jgi:hypothetical protein